MSKFVLTPNPTFKATVPMPVPGAGYVDVQFTFKHRGRAALLEFMESAAKDDSAGSTQKDTDMAMQIATGWDLEDEFNRENIERLVDNFPGSARAMFQGYVGELMRAREGN